MFDFEYATYYNIIFRGVENQNLWDILIHQKSLLGLYTSVYTSLEHRINK